MDKYTQNMRVYAYMKQHGSITRRQAFDELDIANVTARITELREMGVGIVTIKVDGQNRYGEKTQHAVWRLKEGAEHTDPFKSGCSAR